MSRDVSLDRPVQDEDGNETTAGARVADPNSEWQGDNWRNEPRWTQPPRNVTEAIARREAQLAYLRALMRAPYSTSYRRKRRPFLVSDMIRSGQAIGTPLTCRDCGAEFTRRGSRGPVPLLCPDCAAVSRNGLPRVSDA